MRITPLDMEDSSSPWNGRQIDQQTDLEELLEESQQKRPFLLELEGENGFKLIIGIGGPLGCVQFSAANGNPPYLMAATKSTQEEELDVEFLAGGTPTPIPMHRCFPFEMVKKLVFRFFEHGDRSPEVQWEEV